MNEKQESPQKPTKQADPLYFLSHQQRQQFEDSLRELLDVYPDRSADRAALRLLGVFWPSRRAPGHSCRSNTSRWYRDGYTHEMIIAALLITSEAPNAGHPFKYCEAIMRDWYTPRDHLRALPKTEPAPVRRAATTKGPTPLRDVLDSKNEQETPKSPTSPTEILERVGWHGLNDDERAYLIAAIPQVKKAVEQYEAQSQSHNTRKTDV